MEKARSLHKTHGDQTYLGQAICQEMEDKAFPGRGRKPAIPSDFCRSAAFVRLSPVGLSQPFR